MCLKEYSELLQESNNLSWNGYTNPFGMALALLTGVEDICVRFYT